MIQTAPSIDTTPVNTFADPYRVSEQTALVDPPQPIEVERPTLVVGDVHGHFDRLEALLLQEGILGRCPDCDGLGEFEGVQTRNDQGGLDVEVHECHACHGDGQRRINHDVEVVQLGDLGHFGRGASPTGDTMCWAYADRWLDVVLWGNHDRAVIDSQHAFTGFLSPGPEVKHYMHGLYAQDKLRLAHAAHGWLITHAGLHAGWKQQKGIDFDRSDPVVVAEWINENDWWPENDTSFKPVRYPPVPDRLSDKQRSAMAVRDAISHKRGGWSQTGGILWRDEEEKLYNGFPQVYGHSAQLDGQFVIRKYRGDRMTAKGGIWKGDAFNIDIGGKHEARLGAVWLPERRLVRVDV